MPDTRFVAMTVVVEVDVDELNDHIGVGLEDRSWTADQLREYLLNVLSWTSMSYFDFIKNVHGAIHRYVPPNPREAA